MLIDIGATGRRVDLIAIDIDLEEDEGCCVLDADLRILLDLIMDRRRAYELGCMLDAGLVPLRIL